MYLDGLRCNLKLIYTSNHLNTCELELILEYSN
jgi:hypothetical protein